MSHRAVYTVASLLSTSLLFVGAGNACAQDALGGGNALDRNPGVGTGGFNSTRAPDPYASRNAIVTGEVVGGREFRGRVGYTSPTAFRGNLGSNDLYRFRADSAFSNPAIYTMGGSTYDQLRFGQNLGVLELSRDFAGATPAQIDLMRTPGTIAQLAESRFKYDSESLTALSSSRMASAVEPTTLGTSVSAQGDALAISASSVRGITLDQYNDRWANQGLTTYDQIRLRREQDQTWEQRKADETVSPDAADRVDTQYQSRFEDLMADPRVNTSENAAATVQPTDATDYSKVLQRIADRYANADNRNVQVDPAILRSLDEQMRGLSDELAGEDEASSAPQSTDRPGAGRPLPPQGGQPSSSQAPQSSATPGRPNLNDPANVRDPRNPTTPAKDPNDPTGETSPSDVDTPVDLTKLGPALRHGEKVESLTSEQQGRFNELMMSAEALLKSGAYMQAEQRFQRAVRFAPGNAMALAGTANAQIGAGLYLSAGYTLRTLFTQHPEMIDTTYGEGILPARERIDAAIAEMKTRLENSKDRSANALLLAYLGRQLGDRGIMDTALKIMAAESAEDPLPGLLRMVWLEGGETPQPIPAPPEK